VVADADDARRLPTQSTVACRCPRSRPGIPGGRLARIPAESGRVAALAEKQPFPKTSESTGYWLRMRSRKIGSTPPSRNTRPDSKSTPRGRKAISTPRCSTRNWAITRSYAPYAGLSGTHSRGAGCATGARSGCDLGGQAQVAGDGGHHPKRPSSPVSSDSFFASAAGSRDRGSQGVPLSRQSFRHSISQEFQPAADKPAAGRKRSAGRTQDLG